MKIELYLKKDDSAQGDALGDFNEKIIDGLQQSAVESVLAQFKPTELRDSSDQNEDEDEDEKEKQKIDFEKETDIYVYQSDSDSPSHYRFESQEQVIQFHMALLDHQKQVIPLSPSKINIIPESVKKAIVSSNCNVSKENIDQFIGLIKQQKAIFNKANESVEAYREKQEMRQKVALELAENATFKAPTADDIGNFYDRELNSLLLKDNVRVLDLDQLLEQCKSFSQLLQKEVISPVMNLLYDPSLSSSREVEQSRQLAKLQEKLTNIDSKIQIFANRVQKAIQELKDQQLESCIIVHAFHADQVKKRKVFGINSDGHVTVEIRVKGKEALYGGFYALPSSDDTSLKSQLLKKFRLPSADDKIGYFVDLQEDLSRVGPDKTFQRHETIVLRCDTPGAKLKIDAAYALLKRKFAACEEVDSQQVAEKKRKIFKDYNFYRNNCSTLVAEVLQAAGTGEFSKYSKAVAGQMVDTPALVFDHAKRVQIAQGEVEAKQKHKQLTSKQRYMVYFECAIERLKILDKRRPEDFPIDIKHLIAQLTDAMEHLQSLNEKDLSGFIAAFQQAMHDGINSMGLLELLNPVHNEYRDQLSIDLKILKDSLSVLWSFLVKTFDGNLITILSEHTTSLNVKDLSILYNDGFAKEKEGASGVIKSDASFQYLKQLTFDSCKISITDILLTYHGILTTPGGFSVSEEERKRFKSECKVFVDTIALKLDALEILGTITEPQYLFCHMHQTMQFLQEIKGPTLNQQMLQVRLATSHVYNLYNVDSKSPHRSAELKKFYLNVLKELHKLNGKLNKQLYFEEKVEAEDAGLVCQVKKLLVNNEIRGLSGQFSTIDKILEQTIDYNAILSPNNNLTKIVDNEVQKHITLLAYNKKCQSLDIQSIGETEITPPQKPALWKFWQWQERQQYTELETQGELFAILQNQKTSTREKIARVNRLIDDNKPQSLLFLKSRKEQLQRYDAMQLRANVFCLVEGFCQGELSTPQLIVKLEKLRSLDKTKINPLISAIKKKYVKILKDADAQNNSSSKAGASEAAETLIERSTTSSFTPETDSSKNPMEVFKTMFIHMIGLPHGKDFFLPLLVVGKNCLYDLKKSQEGSTNFTLGSSSVTLFPAAGKNPSPKALVDAELEIYRLAT